MLVLTAGPSDVAAQPKQTTPGVAGLAGAPPDGQDQQQAAERDGRQLPPGPSASSQRRAPAASGRLPAGRAWGPARQQGAHIECAGRRADCTGPMGHPERGGGAPASLHQFAAARQLLEQPAEAAAWPHPCQLLGVFRVSRVQRGHLRPGRQGQRTQWGPLTQPKGTGAGDAATLPARKPSRGRCWGRRGPGSDGAAATAGSWSLGVRK